MFWSVPATLFFEAFRAAGNDEATPWSVMANGAVAPSGQPWRRPRRLCQGVHHGHCRVKVQLHALLRRGIHTDGASAACTASGSSTMSFSNRLKLMKPCTRSHLPGFWMASMSGLA